MQSWLQFGNPFARRKLPNGARTLSLHPQLLNHGKPRITVKAGFASLENGLLLLDLADTSTFAEPSPMIRFAAKFQIEKYGLSKTETRRSPLELKTPERHRPHIIRRVTSSCACTSYTTASPLSDSMASR